jgi:deoxyribodipyrimidine photolyase-related protein
MNNIIIFPTQLFYDIEYLKDYNYIYLVEEPRYFTDFKFHKLKLAYHRATMKKYFDHVKIKFKNIKYIEYHEANDFYKELKKKDVSIIYPGDHNLQKKMEKLFGKNLTIIKSKNFLIDPDDLNDIKNLIYKNKKYSHEEFYKYQRRKLNILMDDNKPSGGKWSYDSMNRLPLPQKETPP